MLMGVQHFKRMTLAPQRPDQAHKRRGAALGDVTLQKEVFSPAKTLGPRSLRFKISTAAVDRAGDVVDQSGWVLDAYRRNPVVLWMHDGGALPVGRCTDLGLERGDLSAIIEFIRADMPMAGAMADAVFLLCKEGFLSATSVGFRPIDFDVTREPSRGANDGLPGFDFHKQELTEISVVTVGCNQEALIDPASVLDPNNPAANLLTGDKRAPPLRLARNARLLTLYGDL